MDGEQQALEKVVREIKTLRKELRDYINYGTIFDTESIENLITTNHVKIYASQIKDLKKFKIDTILRQDCSGKERCGKLFNEYFDQVQKACNYYETNLVFQILNDKLGEVEEKIASISEDECKTCYKELYSSLQEIDQNLHEIAGKYVLSLTPSRDKTDEFNARQIVKNFLKPISHPARLEIINHLLKGSRSFNQISEITGFKGGHLIFHLKKIKETGLVRQDGVKGNYYITPKGVKIMKMLQNLC